MRRRKRASRRTTGPEPAETGRKHELEGIILGVDLDGVCSDFYGRMREIAAEWQERPVRELPKSVSYGLPEWGIRGKEEYESLHRFAVTQRDLFGTSKMITGARRFLRRMSDEGARIRIITHRLYVYYIHKLSVSQTIAWLDHNGIPYLDLCFMKEKEQVGADIYIDDNPGSVEKLRAQKLYTICFANSTNRHVGEPRVSTWRDVYALVHRWVAEGSKPRSGVAPR